VRSRWRGTRGVRLGTQEVAGLSRDRVLARADDGPRGSILAIVESGKGTFGRMMADTALFDDTKALVASMKRLMAEIEKNPKRYLKFGVF